jgi:hypothetical protein
MKKEELRGLQKKEAILRMEIIVNKYKLYPRLLEYLKKDMVYYSYVTGNGMIGSVDTLEYDSKYVQIKNSIESKLNCYVYHMIESDMILAGIRYKFLNFLIVSKYEDEWEYNRPGSDPSEDYIEAYVYNIENPKLSELGDIFLDTYIGINNEYPVLIRRA